MIVDIHKPDTSTLVTTGHFYFGWTELEAGLLNAAALVYPCFINSRNYCHAMPGLQDEAWRRFDPLPSLRAQLGQSQKVGPIS